MLPACPHRLSELVEREVSVLAGPLDAGGEEAKRRFLDLSSQNVDVTFLQHVT